MTNNNDNRTSRMYDDDNATTNNETYVIRPQIRTFSDLSTCFFFIFTQFDQNIKEEKIGIA